MRSTLAIVVSLLILTGCKTTGDHTQLGNAGSRAEQHAFLISSVTDICLENIGNTDAIDAAARKLVLEEPQSGKSQIGMRAVTATIYSIGKQGRFAGVVEQKEGESCAIVTAQSIDFSKVIRDAFQLKMEDMGGSFDFDAVRDLKYGFIESHDLPVKQYKQFTKDGHLLDVTAFMTPKAFREESQVFGMLAGALAKREANPEETAEDKFEKVIDEICLPNIGDFAALNREAQAMSGASGVRLDRPEIKMFAEEMQLYALSVSPDGAATFIGFSLDGDLCGYWAVGDKQEKFDIFASYDLMQVDGDLIEDGFVELGYNREENVAIFQTALQRNGQHIYGVMVMGREAYSRLEFHDLPVLPWDL